MKKNGPQDLPLQHARPTVRERTRGHMKKMLGDICRVGVGIALTLGLSSQGCNKPMFTDDIPPLPPPGLCDDPKPSLTRSSVYGRALWEKSGRKWVVKMGVHVPSVENRIWFGYLKQTDVQIKGATIKSMETEPQVAEFVLVPIKGISEVDVNFPILCSDKHIPLRLKLDLSKPRKKKGYIPVELVN